MESSSAGEVVSKVICSIVTVAIHGRAVDRARRTPRAHARRLLSCIAIGNIAFVIAIDAAAAQEKTQPPCREPKACRQECAAGKAESCLQLGLLIQYAGV